MMQQWLLTHSNTNAVNYSLGITANYTLVTVMQFHRKSAHGVRYGILQII